MRIILGLILLVLVLGNAQAEDQGTFINGWICTKKEPLVQIGTAFKVSNEEGSKVAATVSNCFVIPEHVAIRVTNMKKEAEFKRADATAELWSGDSNEGRLFWLKRGQPTV